jgi:hypothetical protein
MKTISFKNGFRITDYDNPAEFCSDLVDKMIQASDESRTICIGSGIEVKNGNETRFAQYFQYNDGGRKSAGFKGETRDCVTRAIAIATGKPYLEVYNALNHLAKDERVGKNQKKRSNARTGVNRKTYEKYLSLIGWEWIPTMQIGSGCKVHLRVDELPAGKIICRVSRHMVAVIDGIIHDTFQSVYRGGDRCVYGYFKERAKS